MEYEGERGCYVKGETSCTDITQSEKGEYSISEACVNRGELKWKINYILYDVKPFFINYSSILKE